MFEEIKEALGKPYFECKYGLIYNMDCKEGLSKLKGHIFSSTITSPPYNIGKEYEHILPIKEYVSWISQISDLVYKVTNGNGSYLLNIGYMAVPEKGRAYYLICFGTRQTFILIKR